MRGLLHISLALMLLLATVACNDSSCYDNGSSLPLAGFYMTDTLGQAYETTITGLTIKGVGVPGDSVLSHNASLGEVYLPLRVSASSTAYQFERVVVVAGDSLLITDTITFGYTAVPYFHSAECGAMYNFELYEVSHTTNGIDSVRTLTTTVTNARDEVLRIYFTDFNQL